MKTDKEKLIEGIQQYVAKRPGESPEFLKAISDGLKLYEQAEKNKRNALADSAIQMLMLGKMPKHLQKVSVLIDIAYHQFPTGPTCHSPNELEWWKNFLEICKKEDNTDEFHDWLWNVKGFDYGQWWYSVILPALTQKSD